MRQVALILYLLSLTLVGCGKPVQQILPGQKVIVADKDGSVWFVAKTEAELASIHKGVIDQDWDRVYRENDRSMSSSWPEEVTFLRRSDHYVQIEGNIHVYDEVYRKFVGYVDDRFVNIEPSTDETRAAAIAGKKLVLDKRAKELETVQAETDRVLNEKADDELRARVARAEAERKKKLESEEAVRKAAIREGDNVTFQPQSVVARFKIHAKSDLSDEALHALMRDKSAIQIVDPLVVGMVIRIDGNLVQVRVDGFDGWVATPRLKKREK